jgi:poly-gamma-glutamate capsule biosynthesis protein CapA/YwtB (metallophosphatase superfamily)
MLTGRPRRAAAPPLTAPPPIRLFLAPLLTGLVLTGLVLTGLVLTGLVAGCRQAPAGPPGGRATPTPSPAPASRSPNPTTGTLLSTSARRRFTLVATGDVLLHPPLWAQARQDAAAQGRPGLDFAPLLAPVRPLVAGADLALCHLETPLAAPGGPYRGYPTFSGPPQIAPALRATGYDACSTASNHTFDQGAAGIGQTLKALDDNGIAHTGSARTTAEAARTTIVRAAGARVALLSYTFGFNGIPYPDGDRWRANLIDAGAIQDAARRARRRGADVVVLSMHWGQEYSARPNAQQLALAPRLARSPDIDLIISHHAHVVQPVQKIGKTWVVHGLGNLLAWHQTPGAANQEGLLVRFTFEESAAGRFVVARAEYRPLLVTRDPPVRVLDVISALAAGDDGSAGRARLTTAAARTEQVVGSLGAAEAGLTLIPGR